jgi:protocatechuate 3,4-dioxygenase beta subunit
MAGLGAVGTVLSPLAWAALRPTSSQVEGPFYPATLPTDRDTDLTVITGRDGQAEGQIVDVAGQVLDSEGAPIAGAQVEIWQANRHGRSAHPRDPSTAPADPGFQGYGVAMTDADGRYAFRTIKPGAYPTGAGTWVRPPHIHFAVAGPGQRLVTQMYFPGEPLNKVDRLLNSAASPESLIAAVTPIGGALAARWDIVLPHG